MRHVPRVDVRFVLAAFVRVREDQVPEYPDHRRPRSPERQGPPRRRPEYDYFHDVDYLDYFDYFPSNPKTMVPNPKIPRSDV